MSHEIDISWATLVYTYKLAFTSGSARVNIDIVYKFWVSIDTQIFFLWNTIELFISQCWLLQVGGIYELTQDS